MKYLRYFSFFSNVSIFYLLIFLLMLSSSVKPTESFFEGAYREYSPLIYKIASLSTTFGIISLIGASVYLYNSFIKNLLLPRLGHPLILFLFLKSWALFVYVVYGPIPVRIFLSLILTLIISLYVLGFRLNHNDTFEHLSLALALYAIFFVSLNLYEFLINKDSVMWAGRLYGITNHPNFIGGYSAILAPFILMQIIRNAGVIKSIFTVVFCCLFVIVLSSGSRSSLASFLVGFIIWSIFYWGPLRSSIMLILGGLVLGAVLFLVFGFAEEAGFN